MDASKIQRFQDVLCTKTSSPITFIMDWTIPNFSFFKEHTKSLESKDCVIRESSWYLELTPLRKAREDGVTADSVALFLFHSRADDSNFRIRVRVKFGIVDVNNDFVEAKSTVLYHTYTEKTSSTFWLGRSSFLKHTDIWGPNSTVLVADKLQLRAEVTYYSLDPAPVDRPRILQCESALTNFEDLYLSPVARDFILVSSEGMEHSVHRAILIARSPVFAAMFESKMSEAQLGRCVIPDVSMRVLAVLIKFMYCGCSVDDLLIDTREIAIAADKYGLTDLVKHCEGNLMDGITGWNVVDLLVLADGVTAPTLKNAAIRFVWMNLAALKSSGALRELCEKGSPELLAETMAFNITLHPREWSKRDTPDSLWSP